MAKGKEITTREQLEQYLQAGEYTELSARAFGYFQKETKTTIVYRDGAAHIEEREEKTTHVPADVEAASLLIWLLEEPGAKRWQMPEGTAVELRTLRRFQAMEKDGATVPGAEIPAAGCITLEQLQRLWQQVKAEQPAAAGDPAAPITGTP